MIDVDQITFFKQNGYLVFEAENLAFISQLRSEVVTSLGTGSLDLCHDYIDISSINDKRLSAFRALNSLTSWEEKYSSIAHNYLNCLLGPDLSIQSKLNLSIQMPYDNTSLLPLHTDSLSGQSVFELVLWTPLTNAYESNSMYIFPPEITYQMLNELPSIETDGMEVLYSKYAHHAIFLTVNYGEAVLFTPTMFHGNVVNKTSSTRVSINCRFKSLFSPESSSGERRLGSFYRILSLSPVTEFGLSYRDDIISFS